MSNPGNIQFVRSHTGRDFLYERQDHPASNVWFYGATAKHQGLTSEPIWEIKRVHILPSGETETKYASGGGFVHIWDNRASYFGPASAPVPSSGTPFPTEVDIYPGSEKFFDYVGTPVVDTPTTVISYTVPAGKILRLHTLTVDSPVITTAKTYINATQIMTGATSPGRRTLQWHWTPFRQIDAGEQILIDVKVKLVSPAPEIGVHLMATEATL